MSIRYLSKQARLKRNCMLNSAVDMLNRHRNQVEFGICPTLSGEDVGAVASFAQLLRQVPQQLDFPQQISWPAVPQCLLKHIVV